MHSISMYVFAMACSIFKYFCLVYIGIFRRFQSLAFNGSVSWHTWHLVWALVCVFFSPGP